MNSDRCPSPEEWAVFAADAASEAEWRRSVRHIAECDACRRHAAILALSAGQPLPPALLEPPPPPLAARTPFSLRRFALRAAAAAVVLGSFVAALSLSSRPPAPPPITRAPEGPPAPEQSRRSKPLPEWPAGLKPRMPQPEEPPKRRNLFPPPPGLEREEPSPSPPAVAEKTPPAPVPAPPPPPSPFLAQHTGRGIGETIQIAPAAGSILLGSEASAEALSKATYVRPAEPLRTLEGGSFSLPDGATIHLARDGEVAVCWSQTLLCYSIDLHRGGALVDLGAAPRLVHVGKGDLGVRLAESSGMVLLASDQESLCATPLGGPAEFQTPDGGARTLRARETLVLRSDRDSLAIGAVLEPKLFPTLEAPAPKPAPPAPPKPVAMGPSAAELVRALPQENYRYRINGRQIREGAWFPQGVLYSSINDLAVIKRSDGSHAHARRASGAWDNLTGVKSGTPEDRLLALLRNAKPPHEQLEIALAAIRGEPQIRALDLEGKACSVSHFTEDPAKIRPEVSALIDQAVLEGRMAKPDYIYWESLDGILEVACSRSDSRVLRALDRRRVGYSYNSVSGLLRRTYVLETVYEFYDHGKASLKLPDAILREMDPQK